uniref:Uncharacterized protein n=1 Tax=Heterorhabditis bacteriophora TaxID=37862 RepID=A0A1I7WVZ0_HETBA
MCTQYYVKRNAIMKYTVYLLSKGVQSETTPEFLYFIHIFTH